MKRIIVTLVIILFPMSVPMEVLASASYTALQENVPQLDGEGDPRPLQDNQGDGDQVGDPVVEAAATLRAAILRIDPSASLQDNGAQFRVGTVPVTLVYDINADRMRLVSPIAEAGALDGEGLQRLMQANFDSALDARYAIARGVLWSTFIHPLSTLDLDEFASGLGQTVNLVSTYGTTYSSGALVFGGGDSQEEQRKLIEELQEKSKEI